MPSSTDGCWGRSHGTPFMNLLKAIWDGSSQPGESDEQGKSEDGEWLGLEDGGLRVMVEERANLLTRGRQETSALRIPRMLDAIALRCHGLKICPRVKLRWCH